MTMAKNLLGSCGGVVVDAGDLSALQVGPSLAPPLHGPKELGIALHVIDDGVGGGGGGGVGVDEVSGATILTLKWRWRPHLSPMKRPEGPGRMPRRPREAAPLSRLLLRTRTGAAVSNYQVIRSGWAMDHGNGYSPHRVR